MSHPSPKPLPPRPNLQHLKYQALDLLKAAKAGDAGALSRLEAGKAVTLADAQRAVAREYGFASWTRLKRHVESIVGTPPAHEAEVPVDLEPFKAAVRAGDAAAVLKLLADSPALRKKIDASVFEMDAPAIVHARHDRAMVDALLDGGADVNARGQFWGRSIGVLDDVSPDTAAYLVSRGALPDLGTFAEAVRSGDVAAGRRLLEHNPFLRQHVNRPLFPFGQRPVAAARKNLAMVDLLLEYGADINLKSDWWAGGFTILDNADPESAKEMIARGAVVDIHAAAHLGMFDRVKELIDQDPAQVNALGGDGKRPLHVASTKEIVELLLERGAEIDARCVDHLSTPAQYAVRQPWKCRLLLERGATPDIFIAAALGDVELAAALVEEDPRCVGARVGEPGYPPVPVGAAGSIYQWELPAKTPHEVAAKLGHWPVYELLMGSTPVLEKFAFACAHGDEQAAREMLASQPGLVAELIAKYPKLLADAAWANLADGVRILLDVGFPVDERGGGEGTALDRAAIRGYVDIVKMLLSRGASVTVKNAYGGAPLGACMWGSLNFKDPMGDYVATAKALIGAGAKVPETTGGSEAVAEVLRRHGAKG
jgi:ankyrin repeat protein